MLDGRRGGSYNAADVHVRYFPNTRRLSIIEQRRSRVNVSGVVTPSPVGPAIENEIYPSPPSPRLAMLGPFLMNKVVSIALPILVMFVTFSEWMSDVCRNPCSLSTATS